ncbi:hypothetical protein VUR80DRAFT_2442 [Thermomyces stellatus]
MVNAAWIPYLPLSVVGFPNKLDRYYAARYPKSIRCDLTYKKKGNVWPYTWRKELKKHTPESPSCPSSPSPSSPFPFPICPQASCPVPSPLLSRPERKSKSFPNSLSSSSGITGMHPTNFPYGLSALPITPTRVSPSLSTFPEHLNFFHTLLLSFLSAISAGTSVKLHLPLAALINPLSSSGTRNMPSPSHIASPSFLNTLGRASSLPHCIHPSVLGMRAMSRSSDLVGCVHTRGRPRSSALISHARRTPPSMRDASTPYSLRRERGTKPIALSERCRRTRGSLVVCGVVGGEGVRTSRKSRSEGMWSK